MLQLQEVDVQAVQKDIHHFQVERTVSPVNQAKLWLAQFAAFVQLVHLYLDILNTPVQIAWWDRIALYQLVLALHVIQEHMQLKGLLFAHLVQLVHTKPMLKVLLAYLVTKTHIVLQKPQHVFLVQLSVP